MRTRNEWHPTVAHTAVTIFILMICTVLTTDARGQSLAEMYRTARFKAQSERLLNGFRPQVAPPERVAYTTDSLRRHVESIFPPEHEEALESDPGPQIFRWQLIPKLGRSWFEKEFGEARWTYIGSNELVELDTTFTRELRALLEATFGAPTQTIADLDRSGGDEPTEFVQFEYWFVLNGTIPLKVMDVNGPFERGLVVASDATFRHVLRDLKHEFLGKILLSEEKAPYVDYYFLPDLQIWFLSGYDGNRYFVDRIRRPDLKLGRPLLDRD